MDKTALDLIREAIEAGRMQRVEPGAAEHAVTGTAYRGPELGRPLSYGGWHITPVRSTGER